ncbi:MAG TPA: ABC transporter permease, partial [Candidatus Acidoferrales bacterium]|nr:ABC transporter permease [Candidatus Acidoferrales bacterium]
ADDLERSGLSRAEAERRARIEFGGYQKFKEEIRESLGTHFLETLLQDARYALRTLRKSPGFTAVAVLTLALGIGANATVFIIADAILFKNLPFADSDRVLYISSVNREAGRGRGESYPDYLYLRSRTHSFEALAAFSGDDVDVSDKGSIPTQVRGDSLTSNAFSVIGQRPMIGRDFLPEDVRPGATPVVILAHNLWQSRYHQNPSIVGRTIRINNVPAVIIGVMPAGINFPRGDQLWVPLIPTGNWQKREYRGLTVFGRLAPGASLASARAELTTLARDLESAYPVTNKKIGVQVETYNDYFTSRDTRLIYLALLGAVAFVLLIACANVANLLLARATGRVREVSIRVALGARRARVIRQLLVESLILATHGGVLGSLLGFWGVRLFRETIIPGDAPAYLAFSIDYRVFAYLLAVTVLTGILFGLAPALRLSRLDINTTLKEGGPGAGRNLRARFLSTVLVVGQIALAFVLLVGAGLMIRSFLNMTRTPIGANTNNILSMDIILRPAKYPTPQTQISFHEQLKARLLALPGIESVAMASNFPGDGWTDFVYELEGSPAVDPRKLPRVGGVIVSPSYFQVLDIRSVRGRVFTDLDGVSGVPVVVANKSFATISWPNEEPLGKRLRLIMPPLSTPNAPASVPQAWLTVVGIVPDIVQSDSSEGAHDPLIYIPYRQLPQREMVVGARTIVPPGTLSNAFRREVLTTDPELPVTDLRTLDALLRERAWPWRIYGSMFSIFAAIAFLLASVGLYAVIAHSVSQRTQEIGIRMALGASPRGILLMVLRQGVLQLLIGLVLGLAASLGLTQALGDMLIGVKPFDPLTFLSLALVLSLAALLGCAIPARRAMRVDPMVALRHE